MTAQQSDLPAPGRRLDVAHWLDDLPKPALALIGLAVSAAVALIALVKAKGEWATSLGDTDDAMRLVMVRDLASGRAGWFDLHVDRLQPPMGVDMHWSRLIDGGLVALQGLFGLFVPHDQAETLMRVVWPLLWIFPAVIAVLAIARRLGPPMAVLLGAAMLLVNVLLYAQWWPGRIDHHDVQITLALAALAGAVLGGVRGPALAGVATGLGLAVGLEGLAFLALAGAAFALRFALSAAEAASARAYGLSLAAASTLFYLGQTAPARWGTAVCDALGVNLWAALALAGLGLAAAAQLTARRAAPVRWGALAAVGVMAAGAYVAIHPSCLHGPMADVDPRLTPIWLSLINEMQPLLRSVPGSPNQLAMNTLAFGALGLFAWGWLGRRAEGRTVAWLVAGATMILSVLLAIQARRMAHYPGWFALPLVAAAFADLAGRGSGALVTGAALTFLISPANLTWILSKVVRLQPATAQAALERPPAPPRHPTIAQASMIPTTLGVLRPFGGGPDNSLEARQQKAAQACATNAAYARLATLPQGLVLGEVDMGPFVLALTPHSAMSAPYHRMSYGILAGYDALRATPGQDEAAVRRLGVTYVLDCPARGFQFNHGSLGPQSLQVRLVRGETPAWLEPMSGPEEPLRVYRVRPLG